MARCGDSSATPQNDGGMGLGGKVASDVNGGAGSGLNGTAAKRVVGKALG